MNDSSYVLVIVGEDEEFVENGMSKKGDKHNIKGRKRKKHLRDKSAPRPPHSG